MFSRGGSLVLAVVLTVSCSSLTPRNDGRAAEGLYAELGDHTRPVTTQSARAQALCDKGLVLLCAFNHDEAIRAFTQATEADPRCVAAWWGIALAHGPHINQAGMTSEASEQAYAALQQALLHREGGSEVERALVDALSKRYAWPVPSDRSALDASYADAMRDVWRRFRADADVGAWCAEALMDLHPWDLWTLHGEARPWTSEIVGVLERVLALDPRHPLGNHLYVHALEASPEPARAKRAADTLRTLVPGASHLVHMPAHIDARIGDYAAASRANEAAIAVDAKYARLTGKAGFYRVYMAHNLHFLAFASMMEGRRSEALKAARAVAGGFTPEFLERLGPFIDGFLPITLEVQVRFGDWEDILAEPRFPDLFGVSNAVRHYARGVAFTALNRLDEARGELDELGALCAAMDERPIGNNPARIVLQIPRLVLRGELAFREGRRAEGIASLREAVTIEDGLLYDEPPDWIMPVRHTLGAALIATGDFEAAEAVFREDLKRWPENGWSLQGLLRCAEARGDDAAVSGLRQRFTAAWSRADVQLSTSCFCQDETRSPLPRK